MSSNPPKGIPNSVLLPSRDTAQYSSWSLSLSPPVTPQHGRGPKGTRVGQVGCDQEGNSDWQKKP